MNYQQALDYILSYPDYEKTPVAHALGGYDLRRVVELLEQLGSPQQKVPAVHIGGTNGKGSTAAMTASVLTASGYRTGLYTSPHLHTIRERCRLNGELISETDFANIVSQIKPEAERLNREAKYGELTTFELITAAAMTYFEKQGADFQVLEVGLGGTYDATNVVSPEVSVITSISLDHTEVLGDTLAEIAAEKAGIIKPGVPLVLSSQPDEVVRVIEQACRERGAEMTMIGRDVTWRGLGDDVSGQSLEVTGKLGNYRLTIPLLGRFQLENAATAVGALEVLVRKGFNISPESIAKGLVQLSWPGRLQLLGRDPILIADGAHNHDAARKLRQALAEHFNYQRAVMVIGASRDKHAAEVAIELGPFFDEVIITRSHHPRAMETAQLEAIFQEQGITSTTTTADISQALTLAKGRAGTGDLICVTGSLFVVAEAIEWTTKQAESQR